MKPLWIVLICLVLVILAGFIVALVLASRNQNDPKDLKPIQTKRIGKGYLPVSKNSVEFSKRELLQKQPIKVWTFWHGKESPTVSLCLDSIKRACDESDHSFDHVHLNLEKAKELLPHIQSHPCFCESSLDSIALTSDIIRFHLLEKYGGFWMDASILFLAPLDQIFDMSQPDVFQAFYNPDNCPGGSSHTFPVIENSMIYSPPNHPLLKGWLAKLNLENCCDPSVRAAHVKTLPFSSKLKHLNPSYHLVYYALYDHLQSIDNIQEIPNVKLYSTRKWRYFAYKTIKPKDLLTLSKNDFLEKYEYKDQKLVKLISQDYRLLDALMDKARDDCLLKE